MGYIERTPPTRNFPKGGWKATVRDPAGKERSKTFERKIDAESHVKAVEGDKVRGDWIDPGAAKRPLREYVEDWRALQVHRDTTANQLDSHLRNHILPILGDRPIGAVRRTEVQQWVKNRQQVLAPATLEVAFVWLSTIFKAAAADRVIRETPCRGVTLPKKEKRLVQPYPDETVAALLSGLPRRMRLGGVLGVGAGLRQGEAHGLIVPNVDFLRRVVRVRLQLVTTTGRPPYLREVKSEAGVRDVPVGQWVVDEIAAYIADYGTASAPDENGNMVEGLVISDEQGRPVSRQRWTRAWISSAVAAGVKPEPTPGVKRRKTENEDSHGLRHNWVSTQIAAGASPKAIQKWAGHASITETFDTYGHLFPEDDDKAREAVDQRAAAWSRPGVG